ncbi:MAG: hypothetical protein ABI781_10215 [Burkholderiales bacterium]
MKLRLLGFALLCGASAGALADAEHDRLASERAAANAKLAEQRRECETRFIVAPCLEDARNDNRATLAQLRQQELKLDEGRRRAVAEARRKAIADKAEAQQGRASDPAPDAPRVRVRREPPAAPVARAIEAPAAHAPSSVTDQSSLEQRNQARFDAHAREAQAHRAAVARRNAQREAQGKAATPLPVPVGAPAPR